MAAAAVAASSRTSVAVSKPIPKISPTKNMCQVLVIERMNRPKNRHIMPRACSWRSSSASSNRPARRPRNTLKIPASTTTLSAAIRYRKPAAIEVPMTPPMVSYPDAGSTTAPNTARAAMDSPTPTTTMIVEWPSAKKNPVPSGRFPSDMSLRVVLSIAEM